MSAWEQRRLMATLERDREKLVQTKANIDTMIQHKDRAIAALQGMRDRPQGK